MKFKLLNYLSSVVVIIGGIALVTLIVVIAWAVWGRYVLNDSPTWTEKLALLLILVVALPISAVCLRENSHLSIGFLTDKLSKKNRQRVEIIVSFSLIGFGAGMAYYSYLLVLKVWKFKIPLLNISQGYQYLPLVITGSLIVIFMLERVWFLMTSNKITNYEVSINSDKAASLVSNNLQENHQKGEK